MWMFRIYVLITAVYILTSCASSMGTTNSNSNNGRTKVISEISSSQSNLDHSDIAKYFSHNLTEYFNSYKYYKISSEVYTENENQTANAKSRVTQRGNLYYVDYIGTAGRYSIAFSNKQFSDSEEIFTFRSRTVLGNAIRSKVYDTYVAWVRKVEIALKANSNSHLFSEELRAAIEIENWHNSLSGE